MACGKKPRGRGDYGDGRLWSPAMLFVDTGVVAKDAGRYANLWGLRDAMRASRHLVQCVHAHQARAQGRPSANCHLNDYSSRCLNGIPLAIPFPSSAD